MARTVLVIDDEPDLRTLMQHNLSGAGYNAVCASDGESGLAAARRHVPDVILLDVMMPGLDGWEVLKRLRRERATAGIPVLMLTAKAEEADRVLGLELGADDYVVKPFGIRELLARIKVLLRRLDPATDASEVIHAGKLLIDTARWTVTADTKQIRLTTMEFNLLKALALRKGRVMCREDLLEAARGEEVSFMSRTIDVHIASLREKLGKYGDLIETVRGVGYRLKQD